MPISDFDFLFGRWTIRNRALCTCLRNAGDWTEFEAAFDCRTLGPLGNVSRFRATCEGIPMDGVSLRLYNPDTDEWTLHWADTVRAGVLQSPVTGRFAGDCGTFYGDGSHHGRRVRVRLLWMRAHAPHFEQAFSTDGGRTWETNWLMSFRRAPAIAAPIHRSIPHSRYGAGVAEAPVQLLKAHHR